ncbi:MAG: protein kinase [Proteobacteria bacterium]|nr:protein kinase [Pseudomonadota bacterium]
MPRCPKCHRRLAYGATCPRDSAQAPRKSAVHSIPVPEVLGYDIVGEVGSGGFATVWRAVRVRDQRVVALKVSHSVTDFTHARFAREAMAMRRIGAPHVPEVYDAGVLFDGQAYLVMELLSGETLAQYLERCVDPPDLDRIRSIGSAVLASLSAVHAARVIHRDLKPDNVFLCGEPKNLQVKLMDFGITKDIEARADITQDGFVLGSSEYMAPEQILGEKVDVRTDIYAFGVMLYEMLTLRVPFFGDRASIEQGHTTLRPPRPGQFGRVPRELENLCLDCLAKNPDRRPREVAALQPWFTSVCRPTVEMESQRTDSGSTTARLLSGSRQLVILLCADVAAPGPAVARAIARRRGIIAGQRGRRYVCVFSGIRDENPAEAAVATARELGNRYDARTAIHIAELTVRPPRGNGPPRFYGSAVEKPEHWLPGGDWRGAVFTAEMAALFPIGATRRDSAHPEFFVATSPKSTSGRVDTTFVGRESIMGAVLATWKDCLAVPAPALITVLGAGGVGKSRLAREIGERIRSQYDRARVAFVAARRRGMSSSDETLERLIEVVRECYLDDLSDGATPPGPAPGVAEPPLGLSGLSVEPAEARQSDSLAGGDLGPAHELGDALREAARTRPLAVLVDDAHFADDSTLEAVEYATRQAGAPLLVIAFAEPRFTRRRHWGERAHRHQRLTVEPLGESDAMALAAEFLRPAEYPPASALRQLVQWTAGRPAVLEALVRELKRRGLVKPNKQGSSWYLATAELDRLPASPVWRWLAARELDALPPQLAACARMCAVLGAEFLRSELEWVLNQATVTGTASTSVDIDVGLEELARCGLILHSDGELWAFEHAAVQEAIYRHLDERDVRQLHSYAVDFWRSRAHMAGADTSSSLAAIARHARGAGYRQLAQDAYCKLAEEAQSGYRHIDADRYYSHALDMLQPDDLRVRARILAGRGKARYRMQRHRGAIDDLGQALDVARELGDPALIASILLDQSAAFDWAVKFAESAEKAEEARPLVEQLHDRRLEALLALAVGRSHFRGERFVEAVDSLDRAITLADAEGDEETRIIAMVLLGPALVCSGRLDRAEACFDEVIARCERAGDYLHLCVAYVNRAYLHEARKSLPGMMSDLRHTIEIAREHGQPVAERAAAHNLAEFHHWSGEHREALVLARRAYELQRFLPEPVATDALLLARILTACSEYEEAREMLECGRELAGSGESAHSDDIVIGMLDIALADAEGRLSPDSAAAEAWDRLVATARQTLQAEEYLEILYFRARAAAAGKRWREVSDTLLRAWAEIDAYPIWRSPFAALSEQIPASAHTAD